MDEKLGKAYKLCSRKTIDRLFNEGQQLRSYPFTVYFAQESNTENKAFQLVFSAPKRAFKRAHDRNFIKRLMKETFRKQKHALENTLVTQHQQWAFFIIYNQRELPVYADLEKSMTKMLQKLVNEITESK